MNERDTGGSTQGSSARSDDALFRRVAATDPPRPAVTVPSVAGRYQVGRRVGRGGLGVVHVGWDPRLRREVALKFVRPDRLRDDAACHLIERLRREARTLAQLDHPALVRVFDVGEADGQLYIAMELLDGPTLRAWARHEGSWRRILAAFLEAARGLAAAHHRGVIHRDFKPDNVVVVDGSRVVVVDFGLADEAANHASEDSPGRARSSKRITHDGVIVGTRGYLAPELLAGGHASAASDQYAWCVACHELLGTEAASIPEWLRGMLRRGLADDPGARFATMDDLVEAVAAGLGAPRRRFWIAVSGVAAATVVWGGGDALLEHQRVVACEDAGRAIAEVWNEDAREGVRTGLLATDVSYAEATIERVLPWVDQRADEWQAASTAACLNASGRGHWEASTVDRSMWCLEERRIDLESIVAALSRADATAAQNALAIAIASELPPPHLCGDPRVLATLPEPPSKTGRAELRSISAELANAYALDMAGRHDEAAAVAAVAVERAAATQWPPLELVARLRLGSALASAGHLEQARRELEMAYFGAERIGWWSIAARAAIRMIGTFPVDEIDRALHWSRSAEVALAQVPEEARVSESDRLASLALAYRARGDMDRASSLFHDALETAERELGPEHPETARAVRNLATALHERGDMAEARPLMERALGLLERALGPEHPATASALNNLAVSYVAAGDYARAKPMHERALAVRERALGPEHPEVATSLNNLANVHSGLGEHEQAQRLMVRAVAVQERRHGPDHPVVAGMVYNLGNIYLRLHDWERARTTHERALVSREQELGVDNPATATSLAAMGMVYAALERTDLAERRYRESIRAFERSLGAEHPALAGPLISLARLELDRGRAAVALPLAKRAVELERRGEGEPARLAETELIVARALWDTNEDRRGARELAQHARDVLAAAGGVWAPALEDVESWLATHP